MSTLGMQMANQERGGDVAPPRTLEFRQAMKDFRIMFPTLDSELIECVLRSNGGHVDSTIDQLLQLSQDTTRRPTRPRHFNMSNGRRFGMDDDSTDTDDSIPSELLDPPTSSDDDIPIRDPPPMYTPHASDASGNFFDNTHPIEVPMNDKKKKSLKDISTNPKLPKKTYRAWNPPMLGALPEDFLRILPQQFLTPIAREKSRSQKSSSSSQKKRPSASSTPLSRHSEPSISSRTPYPVHAPPVQTEVMSPPPGLTGPVIDNSNGTSNNLLNNGDDLTPPPRPPRSRVPPYNDRNFGLPIRSDHIEPGNLFIRQASSSHHHHSFDGSSSRQRHHHRSSRSSHGSSRCHNPQSSHHHQCVQSSATSNSNHMRRSSDFSLRRMVPISHNGSTSMNGMHSPLNERTHRTSQRNSLNHHHHHHSSGHHSPVFHRSDLSGFSSHSRSSRSTVSGSSRSRPRSSREEEQYVEDCRLAILLQNEEFIRELKRNDEFLKALENDRPTAASPIDKQTDNQLSEKDVVPLPDPDGKYTHGVQNSTTKTEGTEELEKDDKAFKENLKHMGKSARKKFNEIAKKFSVRRKSSYKSMKNIDPVFANCDDNFDEAPGPRSPTFDL